MPKTKLLEVKKLALDLKNFRTVPQPNEASAIHAMITINPDWFWALMESLLEDGYHPTENIIVLNVGKILVVKEGNRRIAALKIILGQLRGAKLNLPTSISKKIAGLSGQWKKANSTVPCALYDSTESSIADKIVNLTHGKGEKAGRDLWNSVAKARHNRDMNRASEPALDLLEKYLKQGQNLTSQQAERWAGDFPITVLDEAIKRIAQRIGFSSARILADEYPNLMTYRETLDDVIRDIGLQSIGFQDIRASADFAQSRYGIPIAKVGAGKGTKSGVSTLRSPNVGEVSPSSTTDRSAKKTVAVSSNDPRAVSRALKQFAPKGSHRSKLVTLLEEIRRLKLRQHPHAFCFLLRSMFEISAKAYCVDHAKSGGPSATKANGEDRALIDVLRDVTGHLTRNNTDQQMKRSLHGALADLANSASLLSVTSMNQLIHNPKFSIDEAHICTVFGNIFPLLEEMNR